MTKLNKFECDATGRTYGAKNDVMELDVRRQKNRSPFEVFTRTVHVGMSVLDEHDVMYPGEMEYVGVEFDDGSEAVVGASMEYGSDSVQQYRSREDIGMGHYEKFFTFLEEEVLY